MEEKVLYIKAPMSAQFSKDKIYFKDVFEMEGEKSLVEKISGQILTIFAGDKEEKKVFSIMKVIRMVNKAIPDVQVVSVGESDFVLSYTEKEVEKKWKEHLKLIFLCTIVFIGAAFTIMTFNTDVSVNDVFEGLYQMVAGKGKEHGAMLEVSYSIGIFVGIMGFYNHFKKEKMQKDPTPIHVEMRNYEDEMNKAVMGDAARDGTIIK